MSVSVCAGSTITTGMCHSQRVGGGLQGELRCAVRADHRHRQFAVDARDEHDPALRCPQPRQHCPRHGHLPNDVDLQLPSPLIGAYGFDRPGDDDARVVHQTVDSVGQRVGEAGDVRVVGHIEDHGLDPPRIGRGHRCGVGVAAHPGDDVPVATREVLGDRPAHAPAGAGDEY
jgi:hypothetical protein